MKSPNVVLVSIDSLRGDHCGHLGDERGLTPTLDRLARDGVAFQNAVAPGPQTFSSMPAAFTGHHRPPNALDDYPGDTRWERRLAAIDTHLTDHGSFPERLRELGYTTAAFSPNPWTSPSAGFDRGFDHFGDISRDDGDGALETVAEWVPGVDPNERSVQLVGSMLGGESFFTRWESFYDDVLAVRERLSEPYFLWVFLLDTHFPFLTSRRHRVEQSLAGMYYSIYRAEGAMRGNDDDLDGASREAIGRTYRDSVRAVDAFLARLREDLAADDPVVVVHSDHGESFGDHGSYGHHDGEVFEENVRVPYVVHNAGVEGDVTEPVSLMTLGEVVLTLAREGTFDPADATEPYVVASNESGSNRAVRGERFKYVRHGDAEYLFDLTRDPDERTDISADNDGLCREFRNRLAAFDGHVSETERLRRVVGAVPTGGWL